ncbi:putative RING-H2 finger protein ATL21B [Henckelia pumila]|uniref:putative RING-H2 finger protein ATL21B n=1 Tax=Henckelia pumila TaxID=405737 RepID=UPI003C6E01F9
MILEITFALFLLIPTVHSKKGCWTSVCGNNNNLPIRYPFQLRGQNQKGCDYLALNLTCSDIQDVPLLNLPNLGDFYVRSINYSANTIQLDDTNGCLPRRLIMYAKASSTSPDLIALNYQNYTFFSCPNGNLSSSTFPVISCLSNSTFSVLATSSISRAQEINSLGCSVVETVSIPVLFPLQYEYNGFNDDLVLTWNADTCKACEKKQGLGAGYTVLIVFATLLSPFMFFLGLYALLVIIFYFISLIKKAIQAISFLVSRLSGCLVTRRGQVAPAGVLRPTTQASNVAAARSAGTNSSATNSAINKLNTILVGESRRIPGPNSTCCPICLEEFKPQETIRSITDCEHCFHDSCIDLWLSTHNSCPICRNAAS